MSAVDQGPFLETSFLLGPDWGQPQLHLKSQQAELREPGQTQRLPGTDCASAE